LRDAETQDVLHDCRAGRQRHIETIGDQSVDLAEPAQHRCNQETCKGAVAAGKLMHCGAVFDRIIEGPLAAEHRTDQVERNMARGHRFWHQSSDKPIYRVVPDQKMLLARTPRFNLCSRARNQTSNARRPLFRAFG